MSLRPTAPALALAAVIASVAGARGLAVYVLLVAVIAAAARGLAIVGEVAETGVGLSVAILAGFSLAAIIAAAALHTPGIAILSILALGGEELRWSRARRPVPEPEPNA